MRAVRYRSLAGACARAIRLDLLLLAAHHAGILAASSHVCEPDDVRQVRQERCGFIIAFCSLPLVGLACMLANPDHLEPSDAWLLPGSFVCYFQPTDTQTVMALTSRDRCTRPWQH